jgi:hypothetical protein
MKRAMNANELADELEGWGDAPLSNKQQKNVFKKHADMLRQLAAKLECYEKLADASEMASNPISVKSREALRNVREMKTIMTKEEEIRKAVEAEREACANICETLELPDWPDKVRQPLAQAIRARGKA